MEEPVISTQEFQRGIDYGNNYSILSPLIDEFGIANAILLPRAFCNLLPDPDFGTAIAAAFNDWLAETG